MRKDTLLAFRIEEIEKELFKAAAKAEDMPLGFWARRALRAAAKRVKFNVEKENKNT